MKVESFGDDALRKGDPVCEVLNNTLKSEPCPEEEEPDWSTPLEKRLVQGSLCRHPDHSTSQLAGPTKNVGTPVKPDTDQGRFLQDSSV